ncbi:hypothetical protein EZV62_005160 [Acer yangbiense]|uniref:3'-5' exonuclease domain-containing protein n=1 Tax=Acer yangbiense TaxID=1000413 RepID=A0A5C7IM02_9ROSI|nr:hypothetical protein EZV62_005160 [Acer yangbiense]
MTVTIFDHKLSSSNHNIYDVNFFGDRIRTLVTNSPSMVESWIEEIELIHRKRLGRLIVGLDAEHHPDFNYKNEHPIATLQLCVGHRCLIFQIIHAPDIPQCLEDFLLNDKYSFVGVKVQEDVERLENNYNLSVGNVIDLRTLAVEQVEVLGMNMKELKQAGLKVLSEKVLGKKLEKLKQTQLSKWDNRKLSSDQVQYACLDAFVSFEIARTLKIKPAYFFKSSSQPVMVALTIMVFFVFLLFLFKMSITIIDHKFECPTHNIYDVTFFGDHIRTLVTNSPSMVKSWISEIELIHRKRLHHLVVGLNYKNEPIATLQLCVGHRCLIFQMIHAPCIPQALKNFLSNKSYSFVGVKVDEGVQRLTRDYNLSVGNAIYLKAGLEGLSEMVLGKKVEKPMEIEFSGWGNRWLSSDQVQFACVDAFVSFEIGRIFKSGFFRSLSPPPGFCSLYVMVSLIIYCLFAYFDLQF